MTSSQRKSPLRRRRVVVSSYPVPAPEAVIEMQRKILARLRQDPGSARTAEEVASAIGAIDEVETIFKVLEHMAANPDHGIRRTAGKTVFETRYQRG